MGHERDESERHLAESVSDNSSFNLIFFSFHGIFLLQFWTPEKHRTEARMQLSESRLFKRWDKDVFDVYVEHGLVNAPGETGGEEGLVTLKTPKLQVRILY